MTVGSELRQKAMRWIADDPSPSDRAELQKVLAEAMGGSTPALDDLTERMSSPLTFGTAGLRGPLRAGPAGMNLAVVRRAAAGIAAYLKAQGAGGATVVIGFDARHRSAEFARDAATVLAATGFRALLAPSALPTPVTAFAVRRLNAAAGLQVTASHNPPQDNGLKVYLDGGCQLVGPADTEIEAAIAAARPAISIDTAGAPLSWPDDLLEAYVGRAAGLAGAGGAVRDLRVATTALHGVGGETLVKALHRAGFTDVHVVADQAVPDPDFPTVTFPNPEEPGATDHLLALAAEIGADLAIANDPDADRCSIGVPGADGIWRMLSGDEAGALLGDRILDRLDRTAHPDPLVATTIVSSQMLGRIAAARGARYDETLTGFKWIVRAGDGHGTGLVFGYEEALGLAVDPDAVRDKDGISAAVLACDLAADLKGAGRSVPDVLDDLAVTHGLHTTGAVSMRVADQSTIPRWMSRLRTHLPTTLLGEAVVTAADLLPRTDGVRLATERARVIVRPSGTEPKLKCYLEIVTPVPVAADLPRLRAAAAVDLAALKAEVTALIQG
ncbi:phosphomannomutase [Nakamurella panacisegetis]|uniref:Phosphomannomutase n=1 Tax=Nakamurella panacisegetis TaxID=1090615 RepID=A0A1H0PC74_9ACTN|nr:phospho-sugar mutase [Nakamurella panacisegetis]SDP02601.1 phosphomannomutase [Nakamurella panacisegetis]